MKKSMAVIILLFITILTLPEVLSAGTLKSIVCIAEDYHKNPSYNSISRGLAVNIKYINYFLKQLKKHKIMKVDYPIILRGSAGSGANLMNAIRKINVQPDDVLLVFYGGHGGMTKGKTFIYGTDEKILYRHDLSKEVSSKSARLKILITDSCSSSIDGMPSERAFSKASEQRAKNWNILFNQYKGFFHITAATEGEFGWISPVTGGWFTNAIFNKVLTRNPPNSWRQVAISSRIMTANMFKSSYRYFLPKQKLEMSSKGIRGQNPKVYSYPKFTGNNGNIADKKEPPKNEKPGDVKLFSASKGDYTDKIVLYWKTSPRAEKYFIYRIERGENKWQILTVTSNTRYDDFKVQPNKSYDYIIIAYNRHGLSNYSRATTGWIKRYQPDSGDQNPYEKDNDDWADDNGENQSERDDW